MKAWFAIRLRAAIAAAASLTGKRFGLLVASSLVATSAIVAAGMSSGGKDLGPLATLVGHSLAADKTPIEEAAPEPEPEPEAVTPEPEGEPLVPEFAPEPVEEEVPPEPEPEPEEEAAPPAEEKKPEAGRIKHVFVVSLASPGYEAAFGATSQMPYLSGTLRAKGDLLSGFKLLNENWLPNSFASVAGQAPTADSEKDCPKYEACIFSAETLSFADELTTYQFTWSGYIEGMVDTTGKPANCIHPEPGVEETPVLGGYSSKLNPFVYFHSLLDLGECSANDKPFTEFEKDIRKTTTTPNFSYVSPDLCNAGVPGQCAPGTPEGAAAADAWLATWIPKILKSPAYKKDGLLIVTFGAVNPVPNPDPTQPPTAPTSLKTGTLLLSRFLSAGATDATRYDPYTLLATNEELFGLVRLGEAGGKKVRSLAPQLLGSEENSGD
jgi:hypothetical protein